jgi:tetratricopeptide (TPR) repeat protein
MLRLACLAVLFLAGSAAAPPPPASGTVAQTAMADVVADYARWLGDQTRPAPTVQAIAIDLDAARRELARLDPGVIPVPGSPSADRAREFRRRVVVSFAIELAAIGSRRHAAAAGRLVEWACPYVRTHTPLNDFDRAWQLAALAVLEGSIDSQTLRDHVTHAQPVFADEPRLLLARAIADEQFNAPAESLARTATAANLLKAKEAMAREAGENVRTSERAIARFQEAAREPALRVEAALRAGHVQMRLGRFDAALASWAGLEQYSDDPALLYLLHLFRGIAYENRGRYAESRRSYEAALKISPNSHSATLRLAGLSFRYGVGEDASATIDALLADNDPRRDPWWSYYAADWRFFYPRMARVRTLVTGP